SLLSCQSRQKRVKTKTKRVEMRSQGRAPEPLQRRREVRDEEKQKRVKMARKAEQWSPC
ncbi:uncharacterized, partial [Tachysurus ichikawai]